MKQFIELPDLDAIREQLRKRNITQLALAQSSGVQQSVISRIISGEIKDPSYNTVRKLTLAITRPRGPTRTHDEERIAADLMSKEIVSIYPDKTIAQAWRTMKARDFSQLPVFDERNRPIGSISESFLVRHASEYEMGRRIDELEIEDSFPTVGKNTLGSTIADILKTKQAVLVVDKGKAIGIITRHDLIEKL